MNYIPLATGERAVVVVENYSSYSKNLHIELMPNALLQTCSRDRILDVSLSFGVQWGP